MSTPWWLAYSDTRDLRDKWGPNGRMAGGGFAPAAKAIWLGCPPLITCDGTNIRFVQYTLRPMGLALTSDLTRPLQPEDCARYGPSGYVKTVDNVPDDLGEPAGRQPWGP